ncbi:MAG: YigZ family protein [Bacteroidales bacterium]|nr:YigZ family protein [Bacteroidales bacterium]
MGNDYTFRTLNEEAEGSYKEKGSKFLAFALSVRSTEEIKEQLGRFKKEFHDARHHCYAYRTGTENFDTRANDDGEPAGTAGRPILGQIQSFGLTNTLIVVVRYFGGTKLGKPGLIRAYKTAAHEVLSNAKIVENKILDIYTLRFGYPLLNNVMRIIKEEDIQIKDQIFNTECRIEIFMWKKKVNRIIEKMQKINGVTTELSKLI